MHSHFRKLALASAIALAFAPVNAAPATAAGAQTSQEVMDARQEAQIWTTFALNPHLRALDLKVAVHGGKATLTGKVDEGITKDLAKQLALGVNGIKEVDNQITVEPGYAPQTPATSDRGYGGVVDDATITATVKSKLLWSRYTDGLSTDVDTRDGKVTLNGTADSAAARDLAGSLATNTRGVVAVDNRLTVVEAKPDASGKAKGGIKKTEARVSDGWITTKVKSTLMYSNHVNASAINVNTNGGVVTLSGTVSTPAERALAIELAQNVRGVQSVSADKLQAASGGK